MEFRSVKRWAKLSYFFVRLVLAFLNPIHEFWMDLSVFQLWKLAREGEDLKLIIGEFRESGKEMELAFAELVRINFG